MRTSSSSLPVSSRALLNGIAVSVLSAALAACGSTTPPKTAQDIPAPATSPVKLATFPPVAPPMAAPSEPAPRLLEHLSSSYVVEGKEDLMDVARKFDLGVLEMKIANPGVDEWVPRNGTHVEIPSSHLLPGHLDNGILVNLAQLRIYLFKNGTMVETHPLGIGREALNTPMGSTTIVNKLKDPTWTPTARMHAENPDLPPVVGPGPDNPLGDRALYLGWPLYRIHGTNIPWGVGRRSSSGCMRLYPEDITVFFEHVEVGTKVTVINDQVVVGAVKDQLYLSVYPTLEGWDEVQDDKPLTKKINITSDYVDRIVTTANKKFTIDWPAVYQAFKEARGYPVLIGTPVANTAALAPATTAPKQ